MSRSRIAKIFLAALVVAFVAACGNFEPPPEGKCLSNRGEWTTNELFCDSME
jgi:hypothetical protein